MGSNNVRIKPTINRKIASPALNTLQRANERNEIADEIKEDGSHY